MLPIDRVSGFADPMSATLTMPPQERPAARAAVLALQGRPDEAAGWAQRAERSIKAEAEPAAELAVRYIRGLVELSRGRFADALTAFRAAERLAGRLAAPHLPGHGVQVVEGDLFPVDIQPAYDGHRDLLKLRRGAHPSMRIAYAVHRDASELGRSHSTGRNLSSVRPDACHLIWTARDPLLVPFDWLQIGHSVRLQLAWHRRLTRGRLPTSSAGCPISSSMAARRGIFARSSAVISSTRG